MQHKQKLVTLKVQTTHGVQTQTDICNEQTESFSENIINKNLR